MSAITLRCACCGLLLEIPAGKNLLECPACGMRNARPEQEETSFKSLQRAIELRDRGDFHHAEETYLQILQGAPHSHEALWGRLLCHYGVEYVEDPATGRRLVTVHTVRPSTFQGEADFELACRHAPDDVRAHYQETAAYIDSVQASVRNMAADCPDYDVFLCHKTTKPGSQEMTGDYVNALNLYHYLSGLGLKVFFAPQCIAANVAGASYEAAIYHAIHTAKVMLVLCSKVEYVQSAWVRSEWKRFLELINAGQEKYIIPLLYDRFNAYQMPVEFIQRQLQGVEMGGLNSTQQLTDRVMKLTGQTSKALSAPTDARLTRAFLFLEDGDWQRADEKAEEVLDQDAQNAQAYVVKLLASCKAAKIEDLQQQQNAAFENDSNYKRAWQFGDAKLREQLEAAGKAIRRRREEQRLAGLYDAAAEVMRKGDFKQAEQKFQALGGYRDAAARAEECHQQYEMHHAEEARKEEECFAARYDMAAELMQRSSYQGAILMLEALGGYRDSEALLSACYSAISKKKAESLQQEALPKPEEPQKKPQPSAPAQAQKKDPFTFGNIMLFALIGIAILAFLIEGFK